MRSRSGNLRELIEKGHAHKPLKKGRHTNRYAKALLSATGLDAAPEALSHLAALDSLVSQSAQLKGALTGPQFTAKERHAVLDALAKNLGFAESTRKFLKHIADVKAIGSLGAIIQAALAIYLESKKRTRATVITSSKGAAKQYEQRLKAALEKITDRDVDIEYVTDASLLGGMLVKVGSTMYDGSIKGQMRLLKEELVKG